MTGRGSLQVWLSPLGPMFAYLRTGKMLAQHFVLRRPHDPEFAVFANHVAGGRLLLDVGANSGKAALAFRIFDRTTPILSIEANPLLERDLRLLRRLLRGFDYRIMGAGAGLATLTLQVPVVGGQALTGLASMLPPEQIDLDWWFAHNKVPLDRRHFTLRPVDVTVRPLDDLMLAPSHVKIDVEGLELAVLQGLRKTLTKHRPMIFVERSTCFEEVRSMLEALGYPGHSYDFRRRRLVPLGDLASTNAVFLFEDFWPERPNALRTQRV